MPRKSRADPAAQPPLVASRRDSESADPRRSLTFFGPLPDEVAATAPRDPAAEFHALAVYHARQALETLAVLANGASSEAVRVSAANAIIDRAYGKPAPGARAVRRDENGDGEPVELTITWLDPEPPRAP